MKAFVIRNRRGAICSGWILRKGYPSLSILEARALARPGSRLEEVSVDVVLSCGSAELPTGKGAKANHDIEGERHSGRRGTVPRYLPDFTPHRNSTS